MESDKPIEVLLISNFTAQTLAGFLETQLGTRLNNFCVKVGQFNQVLQELSQIEKNFGVDQHVIVLLRREDFLRELKFVDYGFRSGPTSGLQLYSSFLKEIEKLENLRNVNLYLSNLFELGSGRIHKLNHSSDKIGLLTDKFDSELTEFLRTNSEIGLINVESIISAIGHENSWNSSQEYLFNQPMTVELCEELAKQIAEEIVCSYAEQIKVIAVDADNTLWGGVIGEDPWDQIEFGQDYPGLVYKDFQEFLLIKKSEGVLLVLVTKNNLSDIEEFFSTMKSMPLNLDDFALVESNWGPKSESIKSATRKLNLRLENVIFIDDSPVEVAEVNNLLPEVRTFLLPKELQKRLEALGSHRVIWSGSESTLEDKYRTSYVQLEKERRDSANNVDLSLFLKSLELKLTVQEIKSERTQEYVRVIQLLNKTNQFNFTCERISERQAQRLLIENRVFSGTLSDKFGDYGLIAVGIVPRNTPKPEITNLAVSCRALGRNVEQGFLKFISSKIHNQSNDPIEVRHVKQEKNQQVSNFLEAMGFQIIKQEGNSFRYKQIGPFPDTTDSSIEILEIK